METIRLLKCKRTTRSIKGLLKYKSITEELNVEH